MVLVERCGFKRIILKIDSEIMYKEIIGEIMDRNWRIHPFVKDIQVRRLKFKGFDCSWISKKANQTADWDANKSRRRRASQIG